MVSAGKYAPVRVRTLSSGPGSCVNAFPLGYQKKNVSKYAMPTMLTKFQGRRDNVTDGLS